LRHEGGYVNDPKDPGGETKYGISKRAYPDQDIKALTVETAGKLYKRDYWDKIKGDNLPEPIAVMVFDFAVNAGVKRAVRMMQKLLNVTADGIIGPKTIQAAIKCDVQDFVTDYASERVNYYMMLKTFKRFGGGWLRRTKETLHYCLELA
jgi:lysozyme family protein